MANRLAAQKGTDHQEQDISLEEHFTDDDEDTAKFHRRTGTTRRTAPRRRQNRTSYDSVDQTLSNNRKDIYSNHYCSACYAY